MTLGSNNYYGGRRRPRAPLARRVVGWSIAVLAVFGAGLYAYRTGTAFATREVEELGAEAGALADAVANLEQNNAGLRAALEEEQRRNSELLDQYQRDVPDVAMQPIVAAVRGRLEAGVGPDQLAEIVAAVGPGWACESEPQTKRFVIRTPVTPGGNDTVGFAEATITITGTGASETDEQRRPLAWFDPAQPVTLVFARIGGDVSEVSGLLPLHHSMAVNDAVFRFTVAAGERSFVSVTAQACAFP